MAPWGPWDDPGTPGSTRKETLGSRLRFLLILGRFATPLWKLVGHLGQKQVSLFMFVSRSIFLQIFESESGRLGLPKQVFGVRRVATNIFRRSRNSNEFRVDFWCFSEALGAAFVIFVALETDLKIDGFSR